MVSSTQIRSTESFKTLTKVQQIIITNKNNIREIELGVNMSRLRGFDFWEQVTNPRMCIKNIVKDLLS